MLQRRKFQSLLNTENVTKTKILKLLKYGKCYRDENIAKTRNMLERWISC